ncbi:gas vesicle protein GvpL [Natronomonas sp. LN261]|uniref:gas vesicle protein GvpL n=1 Tax=Natronomonas sp. LN261 TaxID=2750669 RepID=UPI0015EFC9D0|nr:GvpL/GvpF family gas vesicle protein [Natronomonas sp. LN261]
MSKHSTDAAARSEKPNDGQEVTDGRYLYCLVDPTAAEGAEITARGVEDAPVYVVRERGVAAIVHDCERTYGTEPPDTDLLTQRVLRHQQVVDAASEVFGTPLPMRFNTVFEGGNAGVTGWIRDQYDRIRGGLCSFAGTREYRISLLWDPTSFEDGAEDRDGKLRKIQQRQRQAGTGKAFLLEKQYDKRLRELKSERRTELTAALKRTVEPTARELQEQESNVSPSETPDPADREQIARVAVLADETDEAELGSRLDRLVERDGVSVRFTGPWPPYTFAPDLG